MTRLYFYSILVLSALIHSSFINAEIASVNDKQIKSSYLEFIKTEVSKQGQQVDKKMERTIVNRLIDLEVINQKARSSGLLNNERVLAQAELSNQELIYTLYLQDYLVNNPVTEEEVATAYNQYKAAFNESEFRASHILLTSKNKAELIIKKLDAGESFGVLAKKESEDNDTKNNNGDLGWFSKETMVQSFFDAVKNTGSGEIFPKPVKTQFGWHVIKVDDVRPLEVETFAQKEEFIKTELQKIKLKQHLSLLRSGARISVAE